MIIVKYIKDLTNCELNRCNKLIIQNFTENRINTYEKAILYKINNKIFGFLGISNDNYLNQLCVDVKFRNKGIATKLLDKARYILDNNIFLFVDKNKENTDFLVIFYEKQGFIIEYDNEDEYKMFK
tara:strand:- start:24610 stop:24987 length:378 start_codon:yes stop_codon:yes gene_type:complete